MSASLPHRDRAERELVDKRFIWRSKTHAASRVLVWEADLGRGTVLCVLLDPVITSEPPLETWSFEAFFDVFEREPA